MKWAAIFDAHIGAPGWEQAYPHLLRTVEELRTQGYRIVWGGDTMDWVLDSSARIPDGLVQEGDVWLMGNHDPEPLPGLPAHHFLSLEGVFLVHGDDADVGWATAVLEVVTRGRLNRAWKWNLYRMLMGAPDWALRALQAWYYRALGGRLGLQRADWQALLALLPFAPSLLFWETPRLYPPLEPEVTPSLMRPGPIIAKDPETLAQRILTLYPQARSAHTLVMGHLHAPMDAHTSTGKRLIVAPSWVPGTTWGYVLLEEGRVSLVTQSAH